MHLETIKDFDWLNEPEFNFASGSLVVKAALQTDFFQDKRSNIAKDNGHFFYTKQEGNFVFKVVWKIASGQPEGAQYGLMGRIDAQNLCKLALIKDKNENLFLSSSVIQNGYIDTAVQLLNGKCEEITFQLCVDDGYLNLFYTLDGTHFIFVRRFCFLAADSKLAAGAYICNPSTQNFAAVLKDISVKAY